VVRSALPYGVQGGGMRDLFGHELSGSAPPPLPEKAFDGRTYEPERDYVRHSGQLKRVYNLMQDGQWRTLDHVVARTGGTVASASARLRDLRKAKYGAFEVKRRHIERGLFEYRVKA
jgi:hypothetical protein